ncbi:hypothetical protein NDU88_003464 [Pleurodeles waltl]|uniref:Uncharacterized protein n=1 Tax=Pleurodeles waltl TaxID=8319 RepID=A0AAV7RCY8_PLEWA|nr:hypothetical protein NDU88_003464 [Pleurodeles waltl]
MTSMNWGGRVADLEHTIDSRSEDQEALWRKVTALEEQQIDLQVMQEDIENKSRRNNIRIREGPRGMEGTDIVAFTAELHHKI